MLKHYILLESPHAGSFKSVVMHLDAIQEQNVAERHEEEWGF